MKTHSDILQYAAKLSAISKGKSLSDRDSNTRIVFHRKHCEIISGGLFAICCLQVPTEKVIDEPFSVEISNEIIQSIASELRDESDVDITLQGGMVSFRFAKGFIEVPNRTLWNGFTFEYRQDSFCEIDQPSAQAMLSSVPKLLSSGEESNALAAMRLSVSDSGRLDIQSTDTKIAVRLSLPCKGKIPVTLVPFAASGVIRWAVNEFGHSDVLRIAQENMQIVVRCGPFHAWIKQVDIRFKDVEPVIARFKSLNEGKCDFSTKSVLSASSQAEKMGYPSCKVFMESKTRIEAGDEKGDRFSVSVDGKYSHEAKFKLSPDYVSTAMSCMSKLSFDRFDLGYSVSNSGVPVVLSASRGDVSVDVAIAPLVWA